MNLLIKSALVIDEKSEHNAQIKDILIIDGIIKTIANTIENKDNIEVYDAKDQCISIGWLDLRANFRDPGMEHKEDIDSGVLAAMHGGFTEVAILPSTQPPIHSKAEIQYVKSKSAGKLVNVLPIGAVTLNREGKEMAEMYDMHQTGAVAFYDDRNIANASILMRALMYVKNFNGIVMSHPNDKSISDKGMMNEGVNSTLLGLKGMPALAETIMINRDLQLAEYNNSPIHFTGISCAESVAMIKQSKLKGIKVTADINAHQIAITDNALADFDSNYKVRPPFRTQTDITALINGLLDGTIDAICSDHQPEDIESKNVEYEHAAFGIIGLETAYAIANTHLKDKLSDTQIINKFTVAPRKILNMPVPSIKEGEKANITLFNPTLKWLFDKVAIKSKSSNTPFIGHTFTVKALAVYNNNLFYKIL
jgi:dihydroorotase